AGSVLRNPRFHQLPHERRRQRILRLKTNRALAGVEILQVVLGRSHRPVEGTVFRRRTEIRNGPSVETERWEPIADALVSAWRGRADDLSQPFECDPFVARQ